MKEAILTGGYFAASAFKGADLTGVSARGAQFHGVTFEGAVLRDAILEGVAVDGGTRFENAEVDGCRMERQTLERLEDYGGLTRGRRMTMHIEDPVAEMRSYYSGVWQWIHVTALLVFLFPYVVFIWKKYLVASFGLVGSESVTLWTALRVFVLTGGTGAAVAWGPFGVFCYSTVYNALRVVLLYKTKALELKQDASGLPAPFSLAGTWGRLLATAHVMFVGNLILVAYHTWHFLQMRVPR
jgi:hypothetical protein